MATYPIKLMYDESGHAFVPLTSMDAVIGEKNVQYILDAVELSPGHFQIKITDMQLDKLLNTAIIVRWPQINSTVKPSYLQLNDEEEKLLYNGNGTEYLSLEDASNTINILAFSEDKWILASGAGAGGGGHIISDAEGNTLEQQKILQFAGFNIENDAANRATKISNPQPINNLTTTEIGIGSLDAYQGHVLASRTIPTGGEPGQVLAKSNNIDYQVEWVDKDSDDVITSDGSIEEIVGVTYEEYKVLEAAGELKPTTQYHILDLADQGITFLTEAEIQDMIKDKVNISQSIKGKDLNNYNTTGFFYCNACTNIPTGNNGYLFVQSYSPEYCYQRYITYKGAQTFERCLVAGEWQSWYETEYKGGWVNLETTGGWSAYEGQNPPQIRRIGKQVQLRGLLLATAETNSRYAFVIPEGMKPTIINNLYYSITVANDNAGDNKRAEMVQITPDGKLLTFGAYEESDWFGLEGISWFID